MKRFKIDIEVFDVVAATALATLKLGKDVSKSKIAEILSTTPQNINKKKGKQLTTEEIKKIEKGLNIRFTPEELNSSSEDMSNMSYAVHYWEGCEQFGDLLKKDGITEWVTDLQAIVNDWGCTPENIRMIAMPGEEMDGGDYPLKNKDLLFIDVSRTNLMESGVFVATSHNGSRVYVRRIIERMTNDYVYFTTVDNPKWKEYLEKKWTLENWKLSDIQIVGRVIKNMSLQI